MPTPPTSALVVRPTVNLAGLLRSLIALLTPMLTETQDKVAHTVVVLAVVATAVVVVPLLVDLETANGATASTSPVLPTLVSSVSFSVFPTTPLSNKPVSTSPTTMISPSRPPVTRFPSPSTPSLTLLWTTTLSLTSSLQAMSPPPLCRSTLCLLS